MNIFDASEHLSNIFNSDINREYAKRNAKAIQEVLDALNGFYYDGENNCEFCGGKGYLKDDNGVCECLCMIRAMS